MDAKNCGCKKHQYNDVIEITNDFVVTDATLITSYLTLTINGNGYTISVPTPGLDEMGRLNDSPSSFRVFRILSSANCTINDLTIKGGKTSTGGGAIWNYSGTLTLNRCVISNSRAEHGGGIYNEGALYMNQSYIRQNIAGYGGGICNDGGGYVFLESCTLVENRTLEWVSSGITYYGGGGAIDNKRGGYVFVNNSTLSNNQCQEIGGAIKNDWKSTLYLMNSTVTGNVVHGTNPSVGGAIGYDGFMDGPGNVYIVNSLLAYNYRKTTDGGIYNPQSFILDDVVANNYQNRVRMYYSIYHATLPAGMGENHNNMQYVDDLDGDGLGNTIFSGGILSKITNASGFEIGGSDALVFRPYLYEHSGSIAPTLKSGSKVFQADNPDYRGTRTRFNSSYSNPVVAYYDKSALPPVWVYLKNTSNGQEVVKDQIGTNRPGIPTRGALEGTVDNLYMVKVLADANGTTNGGSINGNAYTSGTSVTRTAIPNAGYKFLKFDYVTGGVGTASTNNPYTFTVNSNITLQPVFVELSNENYITYIGNGNTGGTAPVSSTFTGSVIIPAAGNLTKTGCAFSGWNTKANGSGTWYSVGQTYSLASNLTLYAQWTPVWNWTGTISKDWGTSGNWSKSDQTTPSVPTGLHNVSIPNVVNDPEIAFNATASCNDLTVAPGASLTVKSTASGTGSLITNGTVTGNLTIERYVPGSTTLTLNKYHLVSVPLATSNNSLSGLFLDSYLFKYLPGNNSWQSMGTSITNELDKTNGYMIYYPGEGKTYSFTGQPNTGEFTPTVTYNSGAGVNNFAVVPNPYPSNIDWNAASGWTKTNIGNKIWVYNSVYNNYATWDGTNTTNGGSRYVSVGQAFFVQTTAASPALTMDNGVRAHTTATFLKNTAVLTNQIRVKALANGMQDEILAGFAEGKSTAYDPMEDALKLYGAEDAPQLYTLAGESKVSINQLSALSGSTEVPMHFETEFSGEVTLEFSQLESFPADLKIKLQDKLTGQLINLRESSQYVFTHNPSNAADRFVLQFGGPTGLEENDQNTIRSWFSDNSLYLSTPEYVGKKARVEVFSVSGQLLLGKEVILSNLQHFNLNVTGTVITRIALDSKVLNTKSVVL